MTTRFQAFVWAVTCNCCEKITLILSLSPLVKRCLRTQQCKSGTDSFCISSDVTVDRFYVTTLIANTGMHAQWWLTNAYCVAIYAECGESIYPCRTHQDVRGSVHPVAYIFGERIKIAKCLVCLGYCEEPVTHLIFLVEHGKIIRRYEYRGSRTLDISTIVWLQTYGKYFPWLSSYTFFQQLMMIIGWLNVAISMLLHFLCGVWCILLILLFPGHRTDCTCVQFYRYYSADYSPEATKWARVTYWLWR